MLRQMIGNRNQQASAPHYVVKSPLNPLTPARPECPLERYFAKSVASDDPVARAFAFSGDSSVH